MIDCSVEEGIVAELGAITVPVLLVPEYTRPMPPRLLRANTNGVLRKVCGSEESFTFVMDNPIACELAEGLVVFVAARGAKSKGQN